MSGNMKCFVSELFVLRMNDSNQLLFKKLTIILKGNPKILGTLFCDWNDTGIGYDYDLIELMLDHIAGISEKCWYGDTDRFESGEEFVEAFNKVGNYAEISSN